MHSFLKNPEHVNFPLCLAPMVGLSHVALRLLLREYLPEGAKTIWPTEMLNSRKLPFENLSLTPETLRDASENNLVPQILGNDEEMIKRSVLKLKDWGAVGIDINMGCPVQKALRHNYGVALMGDANYAAEVVRMTVKHSEIPVSVKLRAVSKTSLGQQELLDFVGGLEQAGASWLTLHPRTAEEKRRGSADWSQIAMLKQNLRIPLIGNGDVQRVEDVLRMLAETGCDMVMAGRGLAAKPWMLWQLGEALGFPPPKGKIGQAPRGRVEEGAEYGKALLRLLWHMMNFFPEALALRKFRFYVRSTGVWLPFGNSLYGEVCKAQTAVELAFACEAFFAREIEMSPLTELRQ